MSPHNTSTKLIGILNVTPDSFSDGGMHLDPQAALAAMARMIEAGADVVDIGAESTRPGATALTAEDERSRLAPLLKEAVSSCHEAGREVSIDTRHAATAEWALELGADWINDVSGLGNHGMVEVLRDSRCRIVLMHSLGVPPATDIHLEGDDPVALLLDFGRREIDRLSVAGIDPARIVFDPGLGFGKTFRQNWQILSDARQLKTLRLPILIGHSRKSFLRRFTGEDAEAADAATLSASASLMFAGADYLRVHDVGRHATLRESLSNMSKGE